MAETANWYVVQTYSGYENTVKATIEKTIENRHLEDVILAVSIPMETVTEMTDNGPKVYERKVFPSYVLVKMVMTDESWYIVRNIRGVIGFVGFVDSNTKATPLTDEEIQKLGMEKHEIVVDYAVGDHVKITDGPLTSFSGVVEMIDLEKNKVRVIVSMFGRETPAELELDQVELIEA
ncbi:MAG: transcription termination/antitermination factor NusG [Oscillospiraceae bacterium]|nr:transcription termination/antitermination factor NusG [Oscillospiraceae bacterium]